MKIAIVLLTSFLLAMYAENPKPSGERRVRKAIEKIWDIEEYRFEKTEHKQLNTKDKSLYKVESSGQVLGYLYMAKVYTCGTGGCNNPVVNFNASSLEGSREYFRFIMILSPEASVLHTEITEYAATHGHEIAGKGWLNQFKHFDAEDSLIYGKNIDAITGATISGKNMTREINEVIATFIGLR